MPRQNWPWRLLCSSSSAACLPAHFKLKWGLAGVKSDVESHPEAAEGHNLPLFKADLSKGISAALSSWSETDFAVVPKFLIESKLPEGGMTSDYRLK